VIRAILFSLLKDYAKKRGFVVGETFQASDYALAG